MKKSLKKNHNYLLHIMTKCLNCEQLLFDRICSNNSCQHCSNCHMYPICINCGHCLNKEYDNFYCINCFICFNCQPKNCSWCKKCINCTKQKEHLKCSISDHSCVLEICPLCSACFGCCPKEDIKKDIFCYKCKLNRKVELFKFLETQLNWDQNSIQIYFKNL
jgi:hypothetical protein